MYYFGFNAFDLDTVFLVFFFHVINFDRASDSRVSSQRGLLLDYPEVRKADGL